MHAQPWLFNGSQRETCDGDASFEDLFRSLIRRLNLNGTTLANGKARSDCDEIVVDTELDGWRYVLIRTASASNSPLQLSPREQEIVRMVAEGHPNKVIAAVLNISSWTVGTHLRRIFAKLGVGSRAAMVARCMDSGRNVAPQSTATNRHGVTFLLTNSRSHKGTDPTSSD
jgi:DNA-binding CsgD family transcriptional regulator